MLDETTSADWEYDPETQTTIVHVPQRDKRQETRITAFSRQPIVALGEAQNQTLVKADLLRLLGSQYGEGIEDVRATPSTAVSQAQATAIARMGGPLVRFLEYSTLEEATQQLGQIVVGAPADGSSYSLEASFCMLRGHSVEEHSIEIADSRESQTLNLPFAAGEIVQTTQWRAELSLTWRDKTLRFTHTSKPLFPAISAWYVLVYDREGAPVALDQAMDKEGRARLSSDWKPYRQQISGLHSLLQPHAVLFFREHWGKLEEGRPLAGYIAASIESPDERKAILRFGSPGPATIYLNGQELQEVPVQDWEKNALSMRELRRTAPFQLRKGKNWLLVDTRPPQKGRPLWAFGAAFTRPDGTEAMADLLVH
jgi:hypothetical protein